MVLNASRAPRRVRAEAARLAEVEVAGELAQDHEVEAGDDFGLERRGVRQLGEQERGPEVGEQVEVLAQAQQAAPGRLS